MAVAGAAATPGASQSQPAVGTAPMRDVGATSPADAPGLARTGPGASLLGEAAVAVALCVLGGVTVYSRRTARTAHDHSQW